jgi:hypothetical protein
MTTQLPQNDSPPGLVPNVDQVHRRLCQIATEQRLLRRLLRVALDFRREARRQQPQEVTANG